MQDADSDVALIDLLAQSGDARAFDVLYRRHTEQLYAIALRLTRDREAAADAVHDAWLRAAESVAGFERRSSFRTWITGILINCVREIERSRRRMASVELDDELMPEIVDPMSAAPLNTAGIDPLDLEAAIAALPPRFRQVLVLHDVEGFTHEEIAAALGLVAGTSKSQLARARQRVREMLTTGIPRSVA